MKKGICFVFAVLALICTVPAFAQECTRDSFFPNAGNCGYDVSDYQLDMTWDVDGDLWDVSEGITFTAEWDIDELHFDFTDAYVIRELTVNGIPADHEQNGNDLTVRFGFAHDTEYQLNARFDGKLNYSFIFDEKGEQRAENGGFCMLNEPTNAWRYYICNDHPKDRASYHYSFTVPASFTPAGVGRLLEIREADGSVFQPEGDFSRDAAPEGTEGTVTFIYEAAEPMAPYLFSVCAFPFDLKQKTLDSGVVELDFVDNSLEDLYETAWELAGQQEEIVRLFEKWLGPYPFRNSGAIVAPTRLGAALETQSRPLYDLSTIMGSVFAHELFHQWIGDLIALEDWSDVWIKEGAATFGEYLYIQHFEGQEEYENALKSGYEIIAAGPRQIFDADNTDVMDWLRNAAEDSERTAFDRGAALDAAAAFCRTDQEGTQRIDPAALTLPEGDSIAMDEWLGAMTASCTTLSFDHRSYEKFYEMTGEDLGMDRIPDHYAGPKEISSDLDEMYGRQPYTGASLVYYALRDRLGDEVFAKGMQLMIDRCRYSTVSEEKFIAAFSDAAGEDLTDFIRSWLYYGEAHIPDLPGLETWEEARGK